MHGRLKVKTTAEQQEAKRKEREKKLAMYKAGTAIVFHKRQKKEYDPELFKASGELLCANPDFYTLWNIRREAFVSLKETTPTPELQIYFESELSFLIQCLHVNPKSYGAWHHRGWVMDNMPEADWKKELNLCNKFLELDERNFHCWDYRRFIVSRSKVAPEQELVYTTNKIESNFSNYSSWHYRSKLLPVVHSDKEHPVGIKADHHVDECILAQNAFFTDPSDQSAWFYHRWLLGRVTSPLRIECIHVSRGRQRVVVCLSKATQLNDDQTLTLRVGSEKVDTHWKSTNEEIFSQVWAVSELEQVGKSETVLTVSLESSGSEIDKQEVILPADQKTTAWKRSYDSGTSFCQELSTATSDVLIQELESLQQLHEMEPDNKWVLLTIVSLMRALDPLKYEKETIQNIDKLITVDPKRTNYYLDLRSKYIIENVLETCPAESAIIDLSNKQLSTLAQSEHLVSMETIDFSQNSISCLRECHYFQCATCINLDGNQISNLEGLQHLGYMEELHLCGNNISTAEHLQPLKSCTQLKKLDLRNNPISTSISSIKELLPGVDIIS